MIAVALGLSLLTSQTQPDRLRTILPNESVILVEPVANSRIISLQLWASARGVEERSETHGLRHLLEHILVLGPKRDLDYRLESVGGSIRARTYRDATQIEVDVPVGQMELGLRAISEMLQPVQTTPDQIATEARIIDQEMGLLSDDALLSGAAWRQAFGDAALDPLGDLEVIRHATPADLEAIRRRQFAAQNLVFVISGPVGLDDTTSMARRILGPLPSMTRYQARERTAGAGGQITAKAFGEARAAVVSRYDSMKTVSALAAALSVASRLDDCYVTYTPTTQNGLVILGRTDSKGGLGAFIDGLNEGKMGDLFSHGKTLATGWVQRQMRSPIQIGGIRGLLLSQNVGARPEMMLETIRLMSFNDFKAGVKSLQRPSAVEVEGTQ
jgi:hypothetical protein